MANEGLGWKGPRGAFKNARPKTMVGGTIGEMTMALGKTKSQLSGCINKENHIRGCGYKAKRNPCNFCSQAVYALPLHVPTHQIYTYFQQGNRFQPGIVERSWQQ